MKEPVNEWLLKLVRAGIYDDARIVSDFPHLKGAEWEALYEQAKRQTVSGVACHALSFLPDEKLPPYTLLLRWVARTHRIEEEYGKMCRNINHLVGLFGSAGLHPVLQKGHGVARFYPQPSLRVSGDIDLCFSPEEKEKADSIMAGKGIGVHTAPDGSSCYNVNGSDVEHHSSLIRLYSPLHKKRLDRILAEEGVREAEVAPGVRAAVLSPLCDLLMVNVHIMKHSFGVGIGLRQFCDYALAYRKLMPEIGEKKYAESCRRLGLTRWTDLLHRFVNENLGQNGEKLPYMSNFNSRTAMQTMRKMVIEGGNFGLYRRDAEKVKWIRKLGTFSLFLQHSSLWVRIAPSEAIGIIIRLVRGQVK